MSQLYTWECLHCGLFNYNNQCQACFAFKTASNPVRVIEIAPKRYQRNTNYSICEWLKLDNYPNKYNGYCTPVFLSCCIPENKLIQGYSQLKNGIYEYNSITNAWTQIFTYPIDDDTVLDNDYTYKIVSVEYNEIRNKIYVEAAAHFLIASSDVVNSQEILLQIDPQTHEFEVQNNHTILAKGITESINVIIKGKRYYLPEYFSQTLIPSEEMNNFIAKRTAFERVLIINTANNSWIGDCAAWYANLDGYRLIYIAHTDELVGIGGVFNEYGHYGGTHRKSIYSYSFSDNCWKTKDIVLPIGLSMFGCVLSNDQQYIIIMGGAYDAHYDEDYDHAEHGLTDNIYVWNLKNNTIKHSSIKCPVAACFEARLTPINIKVDELICGYLRKHFSEDVDHKPMDVINVVHQMFDVSDEIHIFHNYNGGHWVINVHSIIDSVYQ